VAEARDQLAALVPLIERVLGLEHPRVLAARRDLARWTGEAGDAAAARDHFAALLPVIERVLGPEHPDSLAGRLAALIVRVIALTALAVLGVSDAPCHAGGRRRFVIVTERSDQDSRHGDACSPGRAQSSHEASPVALSGAGDPAAPTAAAQARLQMIVRVRPLNPSLLVGAR